ncbi:hypothetical protein BDZ94DRAFT_1248483 [Collybia nuda]|uniref:Uncharacterized protein n=1 Tax=Collybia nuda TaxID=64659 RepID=A0A9P6CIN9_9AGAR|nr:hypothetical protein BDZ94DRAFT_1248483 [Collybia nuda]
MLAVIQPFPLLFPIAHWMGLPLFCLARIWILRTCSSMTVASSLILLTGITSTRCPCQGGAAAYPMWLTVDWDPLFYGRSEDASPEGHWKMSVACACTLHGHLHALKKR